MERKLATKRKITTEQFERKYKILEVVVIPIVIALITSAITFFVSFINSRSYELSQEDKEQLNILSQQLTDLTDLFYRLEDIIELTKTDGELLVLAQQQVSIMSKYGVNLSARWPPNYIPIDANELQKDYLSKKYGLISGPAPPMPPPILPQAPRFNSSLFLAALFTITAIWIIVSLKKHPFKKWLSNKYDIIGQGDDKA